MLQEEKLIFVCALCPTSHGELCEEATRTTFSSHSHAQHRKRNDNHNEETERKKEKKEKKEQTGRCAGKQKGLWAHKRRGLLREKGERETTRYRLKEYDCYLHRRKRRRKRRRRRVSHIHRAALVLACFIISREKRRGVFAFRLRNQRWKQARVPFFAPFSRYKGSITDTARPPRHYNRKNI